MLATMVARLLEASPVETQEKVAHSNSVVGSIPGGSDTVETILAGMNPQHMIVNGIGAAPKDSVGNPWTSSYIAASGNLIADFSFNVTAESQGRLQACRLYEMTDDPGVHDMLSFLIARDTMHQNQWLAAIEELEKDGWERRRCRSASHRSASFSRSLISSGAARRARRARRGAGRAEPPSTVKPVRLPG